jgi:membrane fusion protein (multidrug efflux system)
MFPTFRIAMVIAAGFLTWYVADHWNRWVGGARFESTDDAYTAGDVTPLSAKVSGHITAVNVTDFQRVRKDEVLIEIDDADYRAELAKADANVAAARAALANFANQKEVQRALVRQAEATIRATQADMIRYNLEARRQRDLLQTKIAGTQQLVEQANANEQRIAAQLTLNQAQLDQQRALLASLDILEKQQGAQLLAAEAEAKLASNNLDHTRILAPADGLLGLRQVRVGQFVTAGTRLVSLVPMPNIWVIANYKETQMTNIRIGNPAKLTVDAFPDIELTGHVESWSPGTGSTFALLPPDNATGNFTKVVQRLPVKIALEDSPLLGVLVRPGMSVVVTIDTGSIESRAQPPPPPRSVGTTGLARNGP